MRWWSSLMAGSLSWGASRPARSRADGGELGRGGYSPGQGAGGDRGGDEEDGGRDERGEVERVHEGATGGLRERALAVHERAGDGLVGAHGRADRDPRAVDRGADAAEHGEAERPAEFGAGLGGGGRRSGAAGRRPRCGRGGRGGSGAGGGGAPRRVRSWSRRRRTPLRRGRPARRSPRGR